LRKYVFPFGSCLPSWLPPSRLSVKWAPAVGFIFSPALPTPAVSPPISIAPPLPTPPAPHLGCRQAIIAPAPITSPSSNRALTRRNEPNYSALAGRYSPAFAPRAAPTPYKRRAPPPSFTAPLSASLLFSPRLSIALTEHRRRPASTLLLHLG
jgi:hypothetical protein